MAALLGVSQKTQYAMRALYELSRQYPTGDVCTVADIAKSQSIPPRFLEQIFSKLRSGGYIESRRGKQGGYTLAVKPTALSVGEIIRFVEGPGESVQCLKSSDDCSCQNSTNCVFKNLWIRAKDAISDIFDSTTFQDLVDQQASASNEIDYSI